MLEMTREGNEVAIAAPQVAMRGSEVMSQVVGTMGSVNQSAQKIADIIGVIDGIGPGACDPDVAAGQRLPQCPSPRNCSLFAYSS
jgi:hypothetical protein